MVRKALLSLLALTPVVLVAHYAFHAGGTLLFVLSALALMPLAYVIGEATEQVAEHTGPGIGGFLNASLGNAPELIIALFAINDGLPDVVRGSITGSVASTLLLVLGCAWIAGGDGRFNGRSLQSQAFLIVGAVALFLVPSIPSWHGDPNRHSLFLLTLPIAVVLLAVYLYRTLRSLRQHADDHTSDAAEDSWSLRRGLLVLAVATVATALVSESLVASIDEFTHSLGLSQFFVATVIVAIVGNAAEHGGAIVVARRGHAHLAAEIAVSSATQVAVFVAPIIAVLSPLVGAGLALSFRPIEIVALAGAALIVALAVRDGRAVRREGVALVAVYAIVAVAFALSGDR